VALFRFPATEVVHYGAGCVSDLSAVVDRLGGQRAFAVASRWLPDLDDQLGGLLGTRYAGSFTGAAAHVPRASVLAAATAARAAGADLIISVGGGSQIDCASALVLALAYDISDLGEFDAHRARFTYPSDLKIPPVDRRLMPHIAIPTTLSGAESTNVFGVTDPEHGVKDLFIDAQFAASVVLFDPEITRSVPAWLWAASGMRAVDHAVEGILSPRHMPMADALGLEGLRILRTHLVASAQRPDDLDLRLRCQLGAWLCIYALTNVGSGLSHGLGHQIGARFGTLHGVTSACMLPHVMAFNADVTGPALARVAEAFAAADAIEGVHDFIASLEPLGVPHTLQQAGGRWEELAAIAQDSLTDPAVAVNPKPVTHGDLIGLLEAAWS
jgi:alcohol dehydrogenase class IV